MEERKRHTPLLWACIVYFLASVAYNVWNWAPNFQYVQGWDRALLIINLACNFAGAIALIFRLRLGFYLLALGFLIGLADQVRLMASDDWRVPLSLLRFTIPLLVILYCARLSQKGVLKGIGARLRETQEAVHRTAQTFD